MPSTLVLALAIAMVACGGPPDELAMTDEGAVTEPSLTSTDPPQILEPPINVTIGDESGVLEYFAALDWLSAPTPGPDGIVLGHFAGYLRPDDTGAFVQELGRHDGRGMWWNPMFLSADDERLETQANFTTETHPVINYDYQCADGRSAYVSHFVHKFGDFHKPWTRDDFLGAATVDPDSGAASVLEIAASDIAPLTGFLRPTGLNGPFAGAEYAITRDTSLGGLEAGWVSYGFYQYFSFVDAEGTEIEVQVSAPSFDFPDGWQGVDDDPSPTVLDGPTDPLDIINHERVQSRFECGRELADRLAPIIAALDAN